MKTEEGNKLIAEFMNDEYIDNSDSWIYENGFRSYRSWRTSELKYQNSWDWLMPVIKKISDCRIMVNDSATPVIMKSGLVKRQLISLDIEKTWNVVIQFIQWYNTQTQQP